MRKQFNLQDWLKDKNQEVETRDGRIVHSIWKIKQPPYTNNRRAEVCALIDGEEDELVFFEGGRYLPTTEDIDSPFDLFLVTPEEELTEFEQAFGIAMMEAPEPEEKEERYLFLKEKSSELLAIARQELQPEIDAEIEKAYKNADDVMYRKGKEDALKEIIKSIFPLETDILTLEDLHTAIQKNGIGCYKHGFEEGKKVALKDLPRWEKTDEPSAVAAFPYIATNGRLYEVGTGYSILISGLRKLPKEE